MAEAKLRIKQKHDTEANWLKATTFVPFEGELIIYDVDSLHSTPRFKVGDGTKTVGNLPFLIAPADNAATAFYPYLHKIHAYKSGTYNPLGSHYVDLVIASFNNSKASTPDQIKALLGETFKYFPDGQVEDDEELYKVEYITQDGLFYTVGSTLKVSPWNSLTIVDDAVQDYSKVWDNIGDVKLAGNNTFTGTNEFEGSSQFLGMAYFSGSVDFDGAAPTSRNGLATDKLLSRDSSKTYQMPSKSGTFALTSDIPSFNNFTLLTSKPSDWATNYNTYYKKGDFGFFPNLSDSTWAANKFYSAVPAEIDIQTLTQPIKIQVSGTNGWGEYGGLNLSYGRAKLYGIDNSFDDNVGYIDISNGNLTSTVYKADFTLSNPTGDGYGFSVKDTSTLFSVGLNKSQAGDYAQQYYCNINAPLNVTQIHGFTQLTAQPSDWSTKYSSYYVGFDTFNNNSNFFGRSDGLYKPTNDILLNVGEGYKIQLYGKYKSNINTNYSDITLSSSGISLDCAQELSLNTLTSFSMVSNTAYLSAKSVLSLACDLSKLYGSNRFGLTVSGQKAIGIDTSSTSSNNLIRFEMTPKFNTNKIRGMAGVDLSLPASAGLLAHIPTGTSQNAMLFGNGTWQVPVQINDGNFKDYAGSTNGTISPGSIYAPISKPEFTSNVTTQAYSFCVYKKGDTQPYFKSVTDLCNSYEHETHTRISNATEISWTINYRLRGNFVSFTIGTTHKDGRVVMRTFNVSDFLNVISTGTWIDVSGASSTFQFRINTLGSLATTFGIKNNSYNNLTGEWFIILHYAF